MSQLATYGNITGHNIYKTLLAKPDFPAGTATRLYDGLTSLQNYNVDFGFTNGFRVLDQGQCELYYERRTDKGVGEPR